MLFALLGAGGCQSTQPWSGNATGGGDAGVSDAEEPVTCTSSLDCRPGERCTDSRCLRICGLDADCPDGAHCLGGVCALGAACSAGESCTSFDTVCTPGTRWCGEAGPVLCTSQGLPAPSSTCAPGSRCFEGECVPVTCDNEALAVCDGEHIVVCDSDDAQVRAVIDCGSGAFSCSDGACVPRPCQPGERRCADGGVWACNADGTAWTLTDACSRLQLCEVDQCVPAGPCTPGERRCDGEVAVSCRDNRVGWEVVQACDDGYCEDGMCHPAVCDADAAWCEGNVANSCDARGRTLSSHDCGPDALCTDGRCVPRLCQPGEVRCDSGRRLTCSEAGTAWLQTGCGDGTVCLGGECLPEGTRLADGAACEADQDCVGGQCLRGPGFPRGYCSSESCSRDDDCAGGGACFAGGTIAYCAAPCQANSDCRSGYACSDQGSLSICLAVGDPGPYGADFPFPTSCDTDLLQTSFTIDGDGLRQIRFNTTENQTGVFIGLHHLSGLPLRPWELISGDGQTHVLAGSDSIYEANADLLEGSMAVALPLAPQDADFIVPQSAHRLLFTAPDDAVCAYFIPVRDEGTRVDLNLVSVGVATLSTNDDGSLSDTAAALVDGLRTRLSDAGLTLGRVRLRSASSAVETRYAVLRSLDDLQGLVSTASAPGPTVDDALSIDVFVVRDFLVPGSAAVGASGGLPGLAGLHGQPGTGIAVSGASIDLDPSFVAQVVAHELGHFMGLAHTTEAWGESDEPIDDTPSCGLSITMRPDWCPDANNLMFPFVLEGSRWLSAGQLFVLRMSPLTKGG